MIRYAVLLPTALLVGGCGGPAATQPALAPTQSLVQAGSHSIGSHANPKHAWLYVAGYTNSVVCIYDLVKFGTPKIGQITQGISGPDGMTIDGHGTLYVANQHGANVTIYPPGATRPSLTLSQGLSEPVGVAVDVNGDVYVTNRGATQDIVVYPPGQTIPSEYIKSSLIQDPIQPLFDSSRNLYFSDFKMGVSVIQHGSQQPVSLGLQGLSQPAGIALDPSNGNLFVNDYEGPGKYKTFVYKPGNIYPARTLKEGVVSANFLATGTIRDTRYIFVPNFFSNVVSVYEHNATQRLAAITTGSKNINGVAYKPAGAP
jgi:hypothetical protein